MIEAQDNGLEQFAFRQPLWRNNMKPVEPKLGICLRKCSDAGPWSGQGFTLTEVMVATMMTTAIIAAGLGTLTVTQKGARATNQVVNTQSAARTGLDMITADLKLAGFGMASLQGNSIPGGVPGAVGNCAVNGKAAAIIPGDNNPLGADFGPDTISMVVPMTNSIAAVGTLWQVNVPVAPGTIGGPNQPIAVLPLMTNAVTSMGAVIPGGVLALNGMAVSIGGVAGSRIAPGGTASSLNLNPAIPAFPAFGHGTQVYLLQCITYQVIAPPDALNLCQGNAPCLVRGVAPVFRFQVCPPTAITRIRIHSCPIRACPLWMEWRTCNWPMPAMAAISMLV